MNTVTLLGRLTKEPNIGQARNGQTMAQFTLAVDKGIAKAKRDEMEAQGKAVADFINVTAFGPQADAIQKYARKGNRLAVFGSINAGMNTDNNGQSKYFMNVNARNITIIDWPEDNNQGQQAPQQQNQYGGNGYNQQGQQGQYQGGQQQGQYQQNQGNNNYNQQQNQQQQPQQQNPFNNVGNGGWDNEFNSGDFAGEYNGDFDPFN